MGTHSNWGGEDMKNVIQLVLLGTMLVAILFMMGNIQKGGLGKNLETLLGLRNSTPSPSKSLSKVGKFKGQFEEGGGVRFSRTPEASSVDKASLNQ